MSGAGRKWPPPTPTSTPLFGDIVKVTPTSKVVGEVALLMVSARPHPRAACSIRQVEVAFPESVVQFFRGDLGQPYGGFPPALQRKVLKGAAVRSRSGLGAMLPPVDLGAERERIQRAAAAAGDR